MLSTTTKTTLEQAKKSFETSRQRRKVLEQERQKLLQQILVMDSKIQNASKQEQYDREHLRQQAAAISQADFETFGIITEEDGSLLILVDDVLLVVCSFLNVQDIFTIELVCQRLHNLLSLSSDNNDNGVTWTKTTRTAASASESRGTASNDNDSATISACSIYGTNSIMIWNKIEESNTPIVGRSKMNDARSRVKHYIAASNYAKYIQSKVPNHIFDHSSSNNNNINSMVGAVTHYRRDDTCMCHHPCKGCSDFPSKLNLNVFQCPDEYEFFFRLASSASNGGVLQDEIGLSYYTMIHNTFTNHNNNQRSKSYGEDEQLLYNLIWEGFVPVSKDKPKDMVGPKSLFFDMRKEYKTMSWPGMKYFLMMVSMIEEDDAHENGAVDGVVAATEGIAVDTRRIQQQYNHRYHHDISIPTIDSLAITVIAVHKNDKQISLVASSHGASKYAECPVLRMKNTKMNPHGDYNDRVHLWLRISTLPTVEFLGIDLDLDLD